MVEFVFIVWWMPLFAWLYLILGGMFTGAMGGGVAMLVLTKKGSKLEESTGECLFDLELQKLRVTSYSIP